MRRKKILLLSSFGGYGHVAATKTISSLVSSNYDVETIYPIRDLRLWNVPNGEAFYNFLLAHNLNPVINFITRHVSPLLFRQRFGKLQQQIEAQIKRVQPDIVISVIPMINYPASEAANTYNLPFLLVTTDNDLINWTLGMEHFRHPNSRITIGHDLPTTRPILTKLGIPDNIIETVGLPIRPEFLKLSNKEELREKLEVKDGHQVILVIMGGIGGRSAASYVKALSQKLNNIHLLVCSGKNRAIKEKLERIDVGQTNNLTVIPFTEEIHELFGAADLLITKPGPGTINEAIASQVPILLDRTITPVHWEKANIAFVEQKKIGAGICSISEAPKLASRFLLDEQVREEALRGFHQLPPNSFAARITSLIEELQHDPYLGEVVIHSRSATPSPIL